MTTATPFLMFQGDAQAAMDLYTTALPNTHVLHIQSHEKPTANGGTVLLARMAICGREFLFERQPAGACIHLHAFQFDICRLRKC